MPVHTTTIHDTCPRRHVTINTMARQHSHPRPSQPIPAHPTNTTPPDTTSSLPGHKRHPQTTTRKHAHATTTARQHPRDKTTTPRCNYDRHNYDNTPPTNGINGDERPTGLPHPRHPWTLPMATTAQHDNNAMAPRRNTT
ncbi:hypothetical protein K443DRAFT_14073 [Laccaria amethystina LaAM-08-1]|uniref:Uncharacterized protein n=1 Tax=Laccaria amethystina LaAM-08-1 TaxID=1095629 RepID=A0A0C9X5P3_9AGAR|nr:hypothetical protein K443DRAFT_14073 [Laccaria amethystina LaAM-08-1]